MGIVFLFRVQKAEAGTAALQEEKRGRRDCTGRRGNKQRASLQSFLVFNIEYRNALILVQFGGMDIGQLDIVLGVLRIADFFLSRCLSSRS